MKALILAAGKGTRLRPLTEDKPKVLVKVKGRPLIKHIIDDLRSLGVEDITVIMGYLGEKLMDALEDYDDLEFIEQKKQLGTAHAIGKSSFESPFITVNGDVFMHRKNIERAISYFKNEDPEAVIGSFEVESPKEFGVLKVDGNRVTDVLEKPKNPPSNLINTGTYVFTPGIYRYIDKTDVSERGEYEITESLKMMLEDGKDVRHTRFEDYWIDVGKHEDLRKANNLAAADKTEVV